MKCEICGVRPVDKIHTRYRTYYTCGAHTSELVNELHEDRVWVEDVEKIRD